MNDIQSYADLGALASHLRSELDAKKYILLYAYNGTGKTRLSTAFKDLGKSEVEDGVDRDTLYFNAFTEDLFSWHNDLDNDRERNLQIQSRSRFFAGLESMEMETRIRRLLNRYADFDFRIDTQRWTVHFSREVVVGDKRLLVEDIKISWGEENNFIWCFFLAILELALDDDREGPYGWVRNVYIDDPISSLDDQNAIAVATHLARMLKSSNSGVRAVISTHHPLFFNVLANELKRKTPNRYFLSRDRASSAYRLRETGQTPYFHHVAALVELQEAVQSDAIFTHHFNMLRAIMEKTASFRGYDSFSACIAKDDGDVDGVLHTRLLNLLSHGNYSLYEPTEMLEENKGYFRKIFQEFIDRYDFNPALFPSTPAGGQGGHS